jgi:hypothetical protein
VSIQKLSTLTGAGSTIPAAGRFAAVSGGTTSSYSSSGITYQVQTFTASGTLTVSNSGVVDILIVGGGGGAGTGQGNVAQGFVSGAGGGGGVVFLSNIFLNAGTYATTVGAGGGSQGNGSSSSFALSSKSIFAYGGGTSGTSAPGSGGGGGWFGGVGGGGSSQTEQGNSGASGTSQSNSSQGAGGGAGGAASGSTAGVGVANSITGSSVTYGTGGSGVGRAAGAANRGQGGAGASAWDQSGALGGSGVVIVRTVTAGAAPSGVIASGGTQTTYTGNGTNGVSGRNYVVQRFNANGTLTVTQPGYADVLIVSGGSGGGGEYASSGAGGGITFGNVYLGSGSYSVVVGAGSTLSGATATGNPGGIGGTSYLGQYGSPLSTSYSTSGPNAPLTSTITGSSVTYAQTGTAVTANTGNGGIKAGCCSAPPGALGSSGVVIVRYEA